MGLKSIIDIDLDDSKFQRFKELFDRYTEALQKQPEMWKRIGGIHAEHAEHFEEMAGTIGKISALQRKMMETDRAQEKHLTLSEKLWTSISRSSKETFGSIENATRSLSKWAGLLGAAGLGLLGVGSVLGFDRLAGSIGGQRRSAAGVGMSIGEQQSFGINFGRFVNPDAFTSWVAGMQQDVTEQWRTQGLLHRPLTGTSRDMLDVLDAARAFARSPQFQGAAGLKLLGPQFRARGLDLPAEDLRRLRDSGDAEYAQQRRSYLSDASRLNITDRGAQAYQNFTAQMDRVAQQMRAQLGPALLGLTGPLSNLSVAFGNALGAFLKSDVVKKAIEGLAGGLTTFAGYVSSEKFKTDVKGFADDIGKLADAVEHPLSALGNLFNTPAQAKDSIKGSIGTLDWWHLGWLRGLAPDKAWAAGHLNDYMGRLDQHFGLAPGAVELVKQLEHSGDRAVSRAGAVGAFQFMPGTAKQYGVNPLDPVSSAEGMAKMLRDLVKEFHGDVMSVLAAVNYGAGNVERLQGKYGSSWYGHLPVETQNYVGRGMALIIQNQTGGSAITSVAGLGAMP